MTEPGPAQLSPVRVRARDVDLPFGLTWAVVVDALADVDPARLDQARASVAHELQGLHRRGRSVVLRLAYPVASGSTRWRTVFVKETLPDHREAAKYSFLAAHGVPVPQVRAAVPSSGGGEVIVLEFLPRIGVDFASATEVMALLARGWPPRARRLRRLPRVPRAVGRGGARPGRRIP